MFKKINNFFLLGVILASTLASTLFFTNDANAAAPGVYIAPKVKADATASALRTTLALCFTWKDVNHLNGNGDTISASDIAKGSWFNPNNSGLKARTGYIVDSEDGTVQCRNLFEDRNVASAFGLGSNIELACAVGLKRDNGSNCVNGTGDFKDSIGSDESKVYAGLDKARTNATGGHGYNQIQEYVLAAETYRIACKATPVVELSKATADQKNNDDYHQVKVVNSKGEVTTVLYKRSNNSEHAWMNSTSGGNFDFMNQKCDGLQAIMNSTSPEYSAYIKNHQEDVTDRTSDTGATDKDGGDANATSCKVEGIGWIICPVMRFMSKVTDQAYNAVATLLTVPALSTDTSKGLYLAWSVMRNFANVAFVIAFMVIIYSQITGSGVSNYGIKKMLPKLIIAAILVNVSYWICAIAVDVSNIVGSSLKNLMDGIAGQLYTSQESTTQSGAGGIWDGLTVGLLAGTAAGIALYLGLSALFPMLIMALFAIVTVVLILTLRQALIVILVFVSPLAFVAFLLPNTESLFKKWKDLFQLLLVMFPIIALIFGGCELARTVIMESKPGFILQVLAAGVTVVPLFVTPFIIKTTSGLLSRWAGVINNPNKGPFDRMRKGAEGYRKNRQQLRDARALNGDRRIGGSLIRRKARRNAVLAQRERNYNNARSGYVANTALSDNVSASQRALSAVSGGRLGGNSESSQLLDQMANGGGPGARNAALAQSIHVQQTLEAEEVKAAGATIQYLNLSRDQVRQLSMGQQVTEQGVQLDAGLNSAIRAAAIQKTVDTHDVEGVNKLLDSVGSMDERTRESFADSLKSSSQKPAYVGQSAIEEIRQHGKTDANGNVVTAKNSTQLAVNAVNNNTYSAEKIANGDKDELDYIRKIASDPRNNTDNANLSQNAKAAQADPKYAGQISKNKQVVQGLADSDSRVHDVNQAHEEANVQNALHNMGTRNSPTPSPSPSPSPAPTPTPTPPTPTPTPRRTPPTPGPTPPPTPPSPPPPPSP